MPLRPDDSPAGASRAQSLEPQIRAARAGQGAHLPTHIRALSTAMGRFNTGLLNMNPEHVGEGSLLHMEIGVQANLAQLSLQSGAAAFDMRHSDDDTGISANVEDAKRRGADSRENFDDERRVDNIITRNQHLGFMAQVTGMCSTASQHERAFTQISKLAKKITLQENYITQLEHKKNALEHKGGAADEERKQEIQAIENEIKQCHRDTVVARNQIKRCMYTELGYAVDEQALLTQSIEQERATLRELLSDRGRPSALSSLAAVSSDTAAKNQAHIACRWYSIDRRDEDGEIKVPDGDAMVRVNPEFDPLLQVAAIVGHDVAAPQRERRSWQVAYETAYTDRSSSRGPGVVESAVGVIDGAVDYVAQAMGTMGEIEEDKDIVQKYVERMEDMRDERGEKRHKHDGKRRILAEALERYRRYAEGRGDERLRGSVNERAENLFQLMKLIDIIEKEFGSEANCFFKHALSVKARPGPRDSGEPGAIISNPSFFGKDIGFLKQEIKTKLIECRKEALLEAKSALERSSAVGKERVEEAIEACSRLDRLMKKRGQSQQRVEACTNAFLEVYPGAVSAREESKLVELVAERSKRERAVSGGRGESRIAANDFARQMAVAEFGDAIPSGFDASVQKEVLITPPYYALQKNMIKTHIDEAIAELAKPDIPDENKVFCEAEILRLMRYHLDHFGPLEASLEEKVVESKTRFGRLRNWAGHYDRESDAAAYDRIYRELNTRKGELLANVDAAEAECAAIEKIEEIERIVQKYNRQGMQYELYGQWGGVYAAQALSVIAETDPDEVGARGTPSQKAAYQEVRRGAIRDVRMMRAAMAQEAQRWAENTDDALSNRRLVVDMINELKEKRLLPETTSLPAAFQYLINSMGSDKTKAFLDRDYGFFDFQEADEGANLDFERLMSNAYMNMHPDEIKSEQKKYAVVLQPERWLMQQRAILMYKIVKTGDVEEDKRQVKEQRLVVIEAFDRLNELYETDAKFKAAVDAPNNNSPIVAKVMHVEMTAAYLTRVIAEVEKDLKDTANDFMSARNVVLLKRIAKVQRQLSGAIDILKSDPDYASMNVRMDALLEKQKTELDGAKELLAQAAKGLSKRIYLYLDKDVVRSKSESELLSALQLINESWTRTFADDYLSIIGQVVTGCDDLHSIKPTLMALIDEGKINDEILTSLKTIAVNIGDDDSISIINAIKDLAENGIENETELLELLAGEDVVSEEDDQIGRLSGIYAKLVDGIDDYQKKDRVFAFLNAADKLCTDSSNKFEVQRLRCQFILGSRSNSEVCGELVNAAKALFKDGSFSVRDVEFTDDYRFLGLSDPKISYAMVTQLFLQMWRLDANASDANKKGLSVEQRNGIRDVCRDYFTSNRFSGDYATAHFQWAKALLPYDKNKEMYKEIAIKRIARLEYREDADTTERFSGEDIWLFDQVAKDAPRELANELKSVLSRMSAAGYASELSEDVRIQMVELVRVRAHLNLTESHDVDRLWFDDLLVDAVKNGFYALEDLHLMANAEVCYPKLKREILAKMRSDACMVSQCKHLAGAMPHSVDIAHAAFVRIVSYASLEGQHLDVAFLNRQLESMNAEAKVAFLIRLVETVFSNGECKLNNKQRQNVFAFLSKACAGNGALQAKLNDDFVKHVYQLVNTEASYDEGMAFVQQLEQLDVSNISRRFCEELAAAFVKSHAHVEDSGQSQCDFDIEVRIVSKFGSDAQKADCFAKLINANFEISDDDLCDYFIRLNFSENAREVKSLIESKVEGDTNKRVLERVFEKFSLDAAVEALAESIGDVDMSQVEDKLLSVIKMRRLTSDTAIFYVDCFYQRLKGKLESGGVDGDKILALCNPSNRVKTACSVNERGDVTLSDDLIEAMRYRSEIGDVDEFDFQVAFDVMDCKDDVEGKWNKALLLVDQFDDELYSERELKIEHEGLEKQPTEMFRSVSLMHMSVSDSADYVGELKAWLKDNKNNVVAALIKRLPEYFFSNAFFRVELVTDYLKEKPVSFCSQDEKTLLYSVLMNAIHYEITAGTKTVDMEIKLQKKYGFSETQIALLEELDVNAYFEKHFCKQDAEDVVKVQAFIRSYCAYSDALFVEQSYDQCHAVYSRLTDKYKADSDNAKVIKLFLDEFEREDSAEDPESNSTFESMFSAAINAVRAIEKAMPMNRNAKTMGWTNWGDNVRAMAPSGKEELSRMRMLLTYSEAHKQSQQQDATLTMVQIIRRVYNANYAYFRVLGSDATGRKFMSQAKALLKDVDKDLPISRDRITKVMSLLKQKTTDKSYRSAIKGVERVYRSQWNHCMTALDEVQMVQYDEDVIARIKAIVKNIALGYKRKSINPSAASKNWRKRAEVEPLGAHEAVSLFLEIDAALRVQPKEKRFGKRLLAISAGKKTEDWEALVNAVKVCVAEPEAVAQVDTCVTMAERSNKQGWLYQLKHVDTMAAEINKLAVDRRANHLMEIFDACCAAKGCDCFSEVSQLMNALSSNEDNKAALIELAKHIQNHEAVNTISGGLRSFNRGFYQLLSSVKSNLGLDGQNADKVSAMLNRQRRIVLVAALKSEDDLAALGMDVDLVFPQSYRYAYNDFADVGGASLICNNEKDVIFQKALNYLIPGSEHRSHKGFGYVCFEILTGASSRALFSSGNNPVEKYNQSTIELLKAVKNYVDERSSGNLAAMVSRMNTASVPHVRCIWARLFDMALFDIRAFANDNGDHDPADIQSVIELLEAMDSVTGEDRKNWQRVSDVMHGDARIFGGITDEKARFVHLVEELKKLKSEPNSDDACLNVLKLFDDEAAKQYVRKSSRELAQFCQTGDAIPILDDANVLVKVQMISEAQRGVEALGFELLTLDLLQQEIEKAAADNNVERCVLLCVMHYELSDFMGKFPENFNAEHYHRQDWYVNANPSFKAIFDSAGGKKRSALVTDYQTMAQDYNANREKVLRSVSDSFDVVTEIDLSGAVTALVSLRERLLPRSELAVIKRVLSADFDMNQFTGCSKEVLRQAYLSGVQSRVESKLMDIVHGCEHDDALNLYVKKLIQVVSCMLQDEVLQRDRANCLLSVFVDCVNVMGQTTPLDERLWENVKELLLAARELIDDADVLSYLKEQNLNVTFEAGEVVEEHADAAQLTRIMSFNHEDLCWLSGKPSEAVLAKKREACGDDESAIRILVANIKVFCNESEDALRWLYDRAVRGDDLILAELGKDDVEEIHRVFHDDNSVALAFVRACFVKAPSFDDKVSLLEGWDSVLSNDEKCTAVRMIISGVSDAEKFEKLLPLAKAPYFNEDLKRAVAGLARVYANGDNAVDLLVNHYDLFSVDQDGIAILAEILYDSRDALSQENMCKFVNYLDEHKDLKLPHLDRETDEQVDVVDVLLDRIKLELREHYPSHAGIASRLKRERDSEGNAKLSGYLSLSGFPVTESQYKEMNDLISALGGIETGNTLVSLYEQVCTFLQEDGSLAGGVSQEVVKSMIAHASLLPEDKFKEVIPQFERWLIAGVSDEDFDSNCQAAGEEKMPVLIRAVSLLRPDQDMHVGKYDDVVRNVFLRMHNDGKAALVSIKSAPLEDGSFVNLEHLAEAMLDPRRARAFFEVPHGDGLVIVDEAKLTHCVEATLSVVEGLEDHSAIVRLQDKIIKHIASRPFGREPDQGDIERIYLQVLLKKLEQKYNLAITSSEAAPVYDLADQLDMGDHALESAWFGRESSATGEAVIYQLDKYRENYNTLEKHLFDGDVAKPLTEAGLADAKWYLYKYAAHSKTVEQRKAVRDLMLDYCNKISLASESGSDEEKAHSAGVVTSLKDVWQRAELSRRERDYRLRGCVPKKDVDVTQVAMMGAGGVKTVTTARRQRARSSSASTVALAAMDTLQGALVKRSGLGGGVSEAKVAQLPASPFHAARGVATHDDLPSNADEIKESFWDELVGRGGPFADEGADRRADELARACDEKGLSLVKLREGIEEEMPGDLEFLSKAKSYVCDVLAGNSVDDEVRVLSERQEHLENELAAAREGKDAYTADYAKAKYDERNRCAALKGFLEANLVSSVLRRADPEVTVEPGVAEVVEPRHGSPRFLAMARREMSASPLEGLVPETRQPLDVRRDFGLSGDEMVTDDSSAASQHHFVGLMEGEDGESKELAEKVKDVFLERVTEGYFSDGNVHDFHCVVCHQFDGEVLYSDVVLHVDPDEPAPKLSVDIVSECSSSVELGALAEQVKAGLPRGFEVGAAFPVDIKTNQKQRDVLAAANPVIAKRRRSEPGLDGHAPALTS